MKFITLFARSLVIAGLALVLTGCLDEEQQWNAKEIDGMLPDLEFTLTRSDGETVTAEEYQGQVRLMFFGFTNCPDVCPATLSKLTRAIKAMPADLQDDVTPCLSASTRNGTRRSGLESM